MKHKCTKCGMEYEGNFCPECGEKWQEEKTCPNCGAILAGGAKFCNECGYSFVSAPPHADPPRAAGTPVIAPRMPSVSPVATSVAEGKGKSGSLTQPPVMKKLYGIMRFLPALLLLGFSVLCLLFFLAPAGTVSALGVSESLGSVYQNANSISSCLGLIIMDILTLIFAVVCVVFAFSAAQKGKTAAIAGRNIYVTDILNTVGFVLYFVMFIMGCVACGQVGGTVSGAGEFGEAFGLNAGAGAGIVLVIVFGLLFLLTGIACLVGRLFLSKHNPEWKEEEIALLQKAAEEAASKKAEMQGEKIAEEIAATTVDTGVRRQEEIPPVPQQMKIFKDMKKVVCRSAMLKLLPFMLILPIGIIMFIVMVIMGYAKSVDKWQPQKVTSNKRNFTAWTIVYGILGVACTVCLIVGMFTFIPTLYLQMEYYEENMSFLAGILAAFIGLYAGLFLLGAVLSGATLPAVGRLAMAFYGTRNPVTSYDEPLFSVGVIFNTRAQIAAGRVSGKKPGADGLKIFYPIVAVALAGIIALSSFSWLGGIIFGSTKYVEKIHVGYYKNESGYEDYDYSYDVKKYLGAPDNTENGRYEYYSDNYKKLYNRAQELEEEMGKATSESQFEDIMEEMLALEQQAANLVYKRIVVNFGTIFGSDDREANDGVREVILDTRAKVDDYSGGNARESYIASKIELSSDTIPAFGGTGDSLSAKVWFTNGSYHNSYIYPSKTANAAGTRYTLEWTDSVFGTELKAEIGRAGGGTTTPDDGQGNGEQKPDDENGGNQGDTQNKGYVMSEDGETLTFGEYPQTEVKASDLKASLNMEAGSLPTSGNAGKWKDYGYYISGEVESYMWYIDVTYSGEKYRGVYFTNYRPYYTTYSSSTSNSYQDESGYNIKTAYWFKYEPIEWRILEEKDGTALLMANLILDSQQYYHSTSNRTVSGKTVYANNYAESDIRAWLRETFYETAFDEYAKGIIETTTVDNSLASTGDSSNPYTCENTQDKVFLLSWKEVTNSGYGFASGSSTDKARQLKSTDYAKSQGYVSSNSSYEGNGVWWLRSPYGYSDNIAGYVYIDGNADYYNYVYYTFGGVVPALRIRL